MRVPATASWRTFADIRHVWWLLGGQGTITAMVTGHVLLTGTPTRLVWLFPLFPPIVASVTSGSTAAEFEAVSPKAISRNALLMVCASTLVSTAMVVIGALPWLLVVSTFDLAYLSITGAAIAVLTASRTGPWLGWIPATAVIAVAVQVLRTDGAIALIDPSHRVTASVISGIVWVLGAAALHSRLPLEADPERDLRYRAIRRR